MFKNTLFLVFFSFLLLTTLDASPVHEGEGAFFHLPSTPENCTRTTARKRRRSSLFPVDFQQRGTKLPSERHSSVLNNSEEGLSTETTRVDDSFENQIQSYDQEIIKASEKFRELAKKIQDQPPVAPLFELDTSHISAVSETSFRENQDEEEDSSLPGSVSPSLNAGFFEDSNQKPESLLEALSDVKREMVENTHYYTTLLLEKVISIETESPSKASTHWAELVNKTQDLVELLETHQNLCKNHFPSHNDTVTDALSEIRFYQARLAEYEAEESSTDALITRNNYFSTPGTSSTSSL